MIKKFESFNVKSDRDIEVSELLSELDNDDKWVIIDPKDFNQYSPIFYRYKLNDHIVGEIYFRRVGGILSTSILDACLYIRNMIDNESFLITTSIFDRPITLSKFWQHNIKNRYTNYCNRILEYQMDYFIQKEKFPNDEDIKECLVSLLTDDDYDINYIKYGYYANRYVGQVNKLRHLTGGKSISPFYQKIHAAAVSENEIDFDNDFICLISIFKVATNIKEQDDIIDSFPSKIKQFTSSIRMFGNYTIGYKRESEKQAGRITYSIFLRNL